MSYASVPDPVVRQALNELDAASSQRLTGTVVSYHGSYVVAQPYGSSDGYRVALTPRRRNLEVPAYEVGDEVWFTKSRVPVPFTAEGGEFIDWLETPDFAPAQP